MKVVLNKCHGGFSVTQAVFNELGLEWDGFGHLDNEDFGIEDDKYYLEYRSYPQLIKAIEKVGINESSDGFAELEIVDIPDDIEWYIHDYDGFETLHESHQSW